MSGHCLAGCAFQAPRRNGNFISCNNFERSSSREPPLFDASTFATYRHVCALTSRVDVSFSANVISGVVALFARLKRSVRGDCARVAG